MHFKIIYIKIKGGALYYVIFVSFVLSVIALLFIIHRSLKLRYIYQELSYFSKIDNLSSAISLYLSNPEKYQLTDSISLQLFNDDSFSFVTITKEPYGLHDLVTAKTRYKGKILFKTVLAGKDPFNGDSITLCVPDHKQSLHASGNTHIKGNARLPSKGIQRASIEGKPLSGPEIIVGRISQSENVLFGPAASIIDRITKIQDFDSLSYHSQNINSFNSDLISNSFSNQTNYYYSDKDFQISAITAKGNIAFISPATILIKKDAHLNGVIISASKIIVEKDFVGAIQIFAKDSIIIEDNCKFLFPSVICLYNDNVNPIYTEIGKSSIINGSVLIYQSNLSTQKPFLKIAEGAVIKGEVYHKGTINLLGSIHGSLTSEEFYFKTKRAIYINHLLDNEIDFYKLPEQFVGIDIKNGYVDQIIDYVQTSL